MQLRVQQMAMGGALPAPINKGNMEDAITKLGLVVASDPQPLGR